jgi:hypothetical protein
MAKEWGRGGMSGINRQAFKFSTFLPIFLLFVLAL